MIQWDMVAFFSSNYLYGGMGYVLCLSIVILSPTFLFYFARQITTFTWKAHRKQLTFLVLLPCTRKFHLRGISSMQDCTLEWGMGLSHSLLLHLHSVGRNIIVLYTDSFYYNTCLYYIKSLKRKPKSIL